MPEYSKEGFMRYAEKHGPRRAKELLESLGRSSQFMNALDTPAGKELLGDIDAQITDLHREVLMKGIGMSPEEKRDKEALLRAYLIIADRWSQRISAYSERVALLKDPTS